MKRKPNFGKNLDIELRRRNLTFVEAAKKCGVSRFYFYKLVSNQSSPTLDMIYRISKGTGIPVEQLLSSGCQQKRKA